ncbi:MAG: hypothetical protein Q4A78_04760 [Peptostreptococcaceae bacterium]|nr:hypothetical protein [Peptostreptococcaceae bacterium]
MKNNIWKRALSILLAGMIGCNLGGVSYADTDTEIDYDYIQKILTEVGTIEANLNSMGISFSDVMKAEFKNEEVNRAIAEAFLSEVDQAAIHQLVSGGMMTTSASGNEEKTDDTKEKIKKYSERLCYARKIAEINKERDYKAKDIDSETVYMYISHFLDVPGGPPSLETPVDYYSNEELFSAWITDDDRNAYEKYLSFELKNKAKEASAAFQTYAQLAYKEQSLKGLMEYEESLREMKQAMENYDERYAKLAFIITAACYRPLSTSDVPVGDIKIPIPFDLADLLGMDLNPGDEESEAKLEIVFPKVDPFDAQEFMNNIHTLYRDKLHIESKAMRDLYIGMGLSLAGMLKYAGSLEGGAKAFLSGSGSTFMSYVLIDTTNQIVYDSMLINTLVVNKDFYSYVNWLVMAYTARARSVARMMRYMGMS